MKEHKKAFEELIEKLEDAIYVIPSADEEDKVPTYVVIEELKEWFCTVSGGHDFQPDQCGYWQHDYCMRCGEPKYPKLINRKCGEFIYEAEEPREGTVDIKTYEGSLKEELKEG